MTDKQHAWVMTTTLPDGTFDYFRFAAWLQSATLLELQMEQLYVDTCAEEYTALLGVTFGADRDTMQQKVNLYNSLWMFIDNEIFDRTHPVFAPGYPN